MMGLTRFRQRELAKTATREAMDVIQAKTVDAEKANTLGTVKVTMGKNFRFGRQASNDSAVLLAA
jgi:FAD synthase